MRFHEIFLLLIIMAPLYAGCIWMLIDPQESSMFGKRWMYEEEPELSEDAIFFKRVAAVIILIILTIIILGSIFNN